MRCCVADELSVPVVGGQGQGHGTGGWNVQRRTELVVTAKRRNTRVMTYEMAFWKAAGGTCHNSSTGRSLK